MSFFSYIVQISVLDLLHNISFCLPPLPPQAWPTLDSPELCTLPSPDQRDCLSGCHSAQESRKPAFPAHPGSFPSHASSSSGRSLLHSHIHCLARKGERRRTTQAASMNSQMKKAMEENMKRGAGMKEEEKLYKHDGLLYPVIMCPQENLVAMENFQAREDDMVLVAYPKCGTNWLVGVIHKMIAETEDGKKEGYEPIVPPIIEFLSPEIQKSLSDFLSPRFMSSHMHPDMLPASFTDKKIKMLVIFRNPKDTMVSYYHFCNSLPVLPTTQSWDQFFTDFMNGNVAWGSYFDHALAWEKRMDDPNVMIVTFEDMKQDLKKGIQQFNEFFNLGLNEEQIQRVYEASCFTAMKESGKNTHGPMVNVFFRKGEVGDWKNHFSEAQSKEMDAVFEKLLAGTRLGAMLKYNLYCQ